MSASPFGRELNRCRRETDIRGQWRAPISFCYQESKHDRPILSIFGLSPRTRQHASIVSVTAQLAFTIVLNSADANKIVVL